MKTTEVNERLIGKRVRCIFTGLECTGTIMGVVEHYSQNHPKRVAEGEPTQVLCSKGVRIKLDTPVVWGECTYHEYESTARVHDDWGNLQHTSLI